MENQYGRSEIVLRHEIDAGKETAEVRAARLEREVRFQGVLLEHLGREVGLMVEIIRTMDEKLEWLTGELDARSGESECKFEAAFGEIDDLRASMDAASRARRHRFRHLRNP